MPLISLTVTSHILIAHVVLVDVALPAVDFILSVADAVTTEHSLQMIDELFLPNATQIRRQKL